MQFRFTKFASVLIASGIISLPVTASANDSTELEELRGLVQELSQQVKVLQRKGELNDEEATAAKKEAPVVSASERGFSIKSADGNNELRLRGQIQTDARFYPGHDGYSSGNGVNSVTNPNVNAPDTALLKQFRPILQGTVAGKYDFLFTPDFGGGKVVVQDAYVDARFTPWAQIKIGKQKTPFGLERLQGDADGKFIERGLPNNLVPNRDIGVQLHGLIADNTIDYALGVFNGVIDGNSSDSFTNSDTDNNIDKEYVARVFATPFKNDPGLLQNLGVGLAATYSDFRGSTFTPGSTTAQTTSDSNLPSYRSNLGQLSFFKYRAPAVVGGVQNGGTYADGERLRWSPQFYYYTGPFGLFGEYVAVDQDVSKLNGTVTRSDKLKNDAWQIVASWVLTGEDAGFTNPIPKPPFDLATGAGIGAWELVARYGEINIDNKAFKPFGTGTAAVQLGRSYADPRASVKQATAWAAGINWYLNRNLKLALDYEETRFDGGWTNAAGTSFEDRPTEKVVSSRLQIAF